MMRDDPTVPANNGGNGDATGVGMNADMSAVDFNQPINHGFEEHKMEEEVFKEEKQEMPAPLKEKPLPVRR